MATYELTLASPGLAHKQLGREPKSISLLALMRKGGEDVGPRDNADDLCCVVHNGDTVHLHSKQEVRPDYGVTVRMGEEHAEKERRS